ncbi:MAG: hotdog family protein [Hyphococcus sp.]
MKIVIDKRFCGPKTSANGGYAAGVFASVIDGPAAVMLKSPPPLDTPIDVQPAANGAYEAVCGETVVALITPAAVTVEAPPALGKAAVAAARENFLLDAGGEHLLPYCFVCGNKRAKGDGLRIFSGPAPDSPINADFWTPSPDLAGEDGLVRPEFLWAALDCPSAFALRNGLNLALLGRLAVDIKRRPKAGAPLTVAAWRMGREGRKHYSASALYDELGEVIAIGEAVWIELNDPAFLEKLRRENA